MNVKSTFLHMVKSFRMIENMRKAYVTCGFNEDALAGVSGEMEEAIYCLTGEDLRVEQSFDQSNTHLILTAPYLSHERRTEMLMAEYRKNHPDQPKPNTMSQEEFMRYFKENGGYSRPLAEGEGP